MNSFLYCHIIVLYSFNSLIWLTHVFNWKSNKHKHKHWWCSTHVIPMAIICMPSTDKNGCRRQVGVQRVSIKFNSLYCLECLLSVSLGSPGTSTLPWKVNRRYLLTSQVSRYCLVASQSSTDRAITGKWIDNACILSDSCRLPYGLGSGCSPRPYAR